MNEKVIWKNGMNFNGTAASGGIIPIGGGEEQGFKPTELVMIGLAGCTAMDVISILQKKQQQVSTFEVSVNSTRRDDHPKAFTSAEVHYKVTGENIDEASVARAIELSAVKYCSVSATLEKAMPISFGYSIYAPDGTKAAEGTVQTKA
jgi:putative redox protein